MATPLHIVSWNVDGLTRLLSAPIGKDLPALHDTLGSPDILCLQEVRVRPGDKVLVDRLNHALPGYRCGHSLCNDPINVKFRGGRAYGVATYVREDLAPQWHTPDWDREGRILTCELPAHRLAITNVYAVNGTDKQYLDPATGQADGDRHTFKIRVQQQLLETLQQTISHTPSLIAIGDWNVSRTALDVHPRLRTEPPHTAARSMLNEVLIPTLDLVDIFRELHPTARKYTWFNRVAARHDRLDAARVDYALISRNLLPTITTADIAQDQALNLGSDHAPLHLELRLPATNS